MIGEAASLLASLSTDLRHELFIVAGVVNAGEHEVVPHEDAVFVTGGQKGVGAHYRHVGFVAGSEKVAILLGSTDPSALTVEL